MIKVNGSYYKIIRRPELPTEVSPPNDSQPLQNLPHLFEEFFRDGKSWDHSCLFRWIGYPHPEAWCWVGITDLMEKLGWASIELPWATIFVSPWGYIYVVWNEGGHSDVVIPFTSWRSYMATCMGATL